MDNKIFEYQGYQDITMIFEGSCDTEDLKIQLCHYRYTIYSILKYIQIVIIFPNMTVFTVFFIN